MKTLKIDRVSINAGHIASMDKKAAIRELTIVGGNPGKNAKERCEWAKKVYKLIKQE
jgi:hypothetical protein